MNRISISWLLLFAIWSPLAAKSAGPDSDDPTKTLIDPAVEQIQDSRILGRPHFFAGSKESAPEAKALLARVQAIKGGADPAKALSAFLKDHPESGYGLWVRRVLGEELYEQGRYSDALDCWRTGWSQQKVLLEGTPQERGAVANLGIALGGLYSRLGMKEELKTLLSEIPLSAVRGGPAANRYRSMRESLYTMHRKPEIAFNCGPWALHSIVKYTHPRGDERNELLSKLSAVRGGSEHGFSMLEIENLAGQLGLGFSAVRRAEENKEILVPSVVHWQADHYAAIVARKEDLYHVIDPTFRINAWISSDQLEEEFSGYFLVPSAEVDPGWIPLEEVEKMTIRGKGYVESKNRADDKCKKGCSKKNKKMPGYSIDDFLASYAVSDTPIWLETPYGPPLEFSVSWFELTQHEPNNNDVSSTVDFSTLGLCWSCNYFSHVKHAGVVDKDIYFAGQLLYSNHPHDVYHVFLSDGRKETHEVPQIDGGSYTIEFPDFWKSTPNIQSQSILTANANYNGGWVRSGGFTLHLLDGSSIRFDHLENNGESDINLRRHYVTNIADSQGTSITVAYDASRAAGAGDRVISATDSFGRALEFHYDHTTDDALITKVQEVVGGVTKRSAVLGYNSEGELETITDMGGITSTFQYGDNVTASSDVVTGYLTPYGTTSFEKYLVPENQAPNPGTNNLEGIKVTDPEGLSELYLYAEILEPAYLPQMTGLEHFIKDFLPPGQEQDPPYAEVPASILAGALPDHFGMEAITLHWDKKAMKHTPPDLDALIAGQGPLNFEGATAYNWMITDTEAHPILTSYRTPETHRVFYEYGSGDGSTSLPTAITSKVVDYTGILQERTQSFTYNDRGQVLTSIDPLGRKIDFEYLAYNDTSLERIRVTQGGAKKTLKRIGYPEPPLGPVGSSGFPDTMLPNTVMDAAGQVSHFTYNNYGQPTTITNPLGQVYSFNYIDFDGSPTAAGFLGSVSIDDSGDPNINNVTLASFTYHVDTGYLHTATDELTGLTTTYSTYNDFGQATKIVHPDGSEEEFSYDRHDGHEPNGTPITTPIIDLVGHRNREGQWTRYDYNGNRQVVRVTDPEQRVTRIHWCSCGHIEELIDALGRKTKWVRDPLGRVIEKILPDGKKTSYSYQPEDGLLSSITYPREQGDSVPSVSFSYYLDGRQRDKIYPDVPTDLLVSRTVYDDTLGRPESVTWYDELEVARIINLSYHSLGSGDSASYVGGMTQITPGSGFGLGAGRLKRMDGPWGAADTLAYNYDELGRLVKTTIGDNNTTQTAISFVSELTSIDALGRVHSHSNGLGSFSTTFFSRPNDPMTPKDESLLPDTRPDVVSGPGSFKVDFDYFANSEGGYLKQIKNTWGSGTPTTISQFDYTYYQDGKVRTWTKLQGGNPADFMEYVYDLAGQLRQATQKDGDTNGLVEKRWGFGYDRAGNRTSVSIDDQPYLAHFNERNQLTAGDFEGTIPIIGKLDQWAQVSVTVGGETNAARVRPMEPFSSGDFLFETEVTLDPSGVTQVDVEADDTVDPPTSESFQINSGSAPDWATLLYDDNGNTTDRTVTKGVVTDVSSYTWDPENRLKSVTRNGITTEFVYNAFGERVKIIENAQSGTPTERRFIWCGGTQPCQERDDGNVVVKSYYAQGEEHGSGGSAVDYLYTRDHLGSIREIVKASDGSVAARFDYSSFGVREAIGTPTVETEFGFTGHFTHADSGLVLTMYRAYDPELGRWLSPDPIGEAGGINLYQYVRNDPLNAWDPLGLIEWIGPNAKKLEKELRNSTEGSATIARCEAAEKATGKTIFVKNGKTGKLYPETNTVTIPTGRLPLYPIKTKIGSPANVPATLAEIGNHELIHAAQHLEGNLEKLQKTEDNRWQDGAEKEACESTNRMRQETPGRPLRTQYKPYPLE